MRTTIGAAAIVLGSALATVAAAAEPVPPREVLRSGVDAEGKVTDRALAEKSGWRVVRAFAWWVEAEDPPAGGTFARADARREFRHGQRFRIRVEAFCDLYLYVLVHNSDGSNEVLVPADSEEIPFVRRGEVRSLPDLRFTPPAGTERLRLIASPRPLPWVAKGEIFQVPNGFEMKAEEEQALNNLKDIKAVRDRVARGRVDGTLKAADLAGVLKEIGGGRVPTSRRILIVQQEPDENLVALTSADPGSRAVVVHDIELKHVN
jgi:hypothetical protein